ncbi:hypothetical protein FRAHR75_570008 [Frankia sp. Hr75.2]|nr:hypothetical protein FRAHR75_570008 [Frankia sp. Hr75.2]
MGSTPSGSTSRRLPPPTPHPGGADTCRTRILGGLINEYRNTARPLARKIPSTAKDQLTGRIGVLEPHRVI